MTELGFLRGDTALPYCKGCGHGLVLRALGDALAALRLSPRDVAVVTDIGCVGLADSQIDGPHTIHTTHGRSTAFAAGIALADAALGEGRLKTIVMIGDGGSMIGINHLIFGAVINADVTVLVLAGKVEYGQGIRHGLQMAAAEELRLPLERVEVLLADTDLVPWDIGTFGSQSTMVAANFGFYAQFKPRQGDPAPPAPQLPFHYGTPEGYEFYLALGPLWSGAGRIGLNDNQNWRSNLEHTSYDDFWKARSIWRHFRNITPAVLTVGGWFDAEDLMGPLRTSRR